jgi:hypothetical protein
MSRRAQRSSSWWWGGRLVSSRQHQLGGFRNPHRCAGKLRQPVAISAWPRAEAVLQRLPTIGEDGANKRLLLATPTMQSTQYEGEAQYEPAILLNLSQP